MMPTNRLIIESLKRRAVDAVIDVGARVAIEICIRALSAWARRMGQ